MGFLLSRRKAQHSSTDCILSINGTAAKPDQRMQKRKTNLQFSKRPKWESPLEFRTYRFAAAQSWLCTLGRLSHTKSWNVTIVTNHLVFWSRLRKIQEKKNFRFVFWFDTWNYSLGQSLYTPISRGQRVTVSKYRTISFSVWILGRILPWQPSWICKNNAKLAIFFLVTKPFLKWRRICKIFI